MSDFSSSEFPNSSDCISRQAAIDALKGLPTWWADAGGYYGGAQPPMVALLDPEDAVSAIENLPSVQPERKGKWVGYDGDWLKTMCKCSKCGAMIDINEKYRNLFCYHCGARMDGEQDE